MTYLQWEQREELQAVHMDVCLVTSNPPAATASLGCAPARWSPTPAFQPREEWAKRLPGAGTTATNWSCSL